MTRLFASISNLVFSFFLGALLLAFVFIQFPDWFERILDHAGVVKTSVVQVIPVNEGGVQYKNLVRYLIEEAQLIFMFFVIIARIALWCVTAGVLKAVGR